MFSRLTWFAILIFVTSFAELIYSQNQTEDLLVTEKPVEASAKVSLENLLDNEQNLWNDLNAEIAKLSERLEGLSTEELTDLLELYEKEEHQAKKVEKLRDKLAQEKKKEEEKKKKLFFGKFIPGSDFIIGDLLMEFIWVEEMNIWVSKYETTNSEYRHFKPKHSSNEYEGNNLNTDRQPVVYVSYIDALLFAEWLTERERQLGRLPEEWAFRFPTGEEWTYLAQSGDGRKYPWGNKWPPKFGNYDTDTKFDDYRIEGYKDDWIVSCPVENSGGNPWGIFGMGGNALEWTSEKKGVEYVVRGGSWYHFNKRTTECKFKSSYHPEIRFESLGFRLVLAQ